MPETFIKLYLFHNGVAFKKSYFDYFDSVHYQEELGSISFDQFDNGKEQCIQNIYHQWIYDDTDSRHPHVYSFGRTGDGNWICFDYRDDPSTSEPKISIVIHDEYDEETGKWLIFPVANNFNEFLDSLYDFNERYPDCSN